MEQLTYERLQDNLNRLKLTVPIFPSLTTFWKKRWPPRKRGGSAPP